MKMNLQGTSQMKSSLIAAAVAVVIAGCSGGGATSTTPTDPGSDVTPSDLLVTVSTVSADGLKDVTSETAKVTVTAVDANRNVLADAPVSIVPDNTAVVTVSGTTTDTSGVVTGDVGIGTDRTNRQISVVVKSGSITKTLAINVVGATLTATPNPAVVAPGSKGSILYHLADANKVAMPNIAVALSGAFSGTGTTNENGDFVYSYTAPAAEQVLTVNATAGGAQASSTITDAAGTIDPAQGTVQSSSIDANPKTVSTNQAGSTTNQVQVRASFFDALNAPIQNIRVRFDLDGDQGNVGGTLSSGTNYAYSDENGVARTNYIPGTRASGNEKLTIRACWSNNDFAAGTCPHELAIPITVVSEGVSITINTDNRITILETSPIEYQLGYSVQVVDSAGNPKSGVQVSYSIAIPTYYKGRWTTFNGTTDWTLVGHEACGNEDLNGNNRLDDFEDYNADKLLEPSGTATVVPQTSTSDVTNEFGRAYFFVQYGANYANWADYVLTFSASVAGTAGHYSYTDTLPFPTNTLDDPTIEPPFMNSPFGTLIGGGMAEITDPVSGNKAFLCYFGPNNKHGL